MTDKPRLQCRAKQLVLRHLCTSQNESIDQTFSSLTFDASTSRDYESLFMDPSCSFLRYLLTSKSNLFVTRNFLRGMILTLCPSKCYLEPLNSRKFLLDTQTAINILRIVKPFNYEVYIGNDEVGLVCFHEFYPHIKGATKLNLESSNVSRSNAFELIIKRMADQIRELECPMTAIIYYSFSRANPILNLDELSLHSVLNNAQDKMDAIFKHNIKKLKMFDIDSDSFPDFNEVGPQIGSQTLEHLSLFVTKNSTIKILQSVEILRTHMPAMKTFELTTKEIYKLVRTNTGFIDWLMEIYNGLQEFKTRATNLFNRIIVNVGIIKILEDDEEQISNLIAELKETDQLKNATFNDQASIGDNFAQLKLIENGVIFDFQMICMSRLSGSFLANIDMPAADPLFMEFDPDFDFDADDLDLADLDINDLDEFGLHNLDGE